MTLIFDLESNGLLQNTTVIHSLVIYDTQTEKVISCTDNDKEFTPIKEGIKLLEQAEEIAGHNIIKFDLPAIQKIYPDFKFTGKIYDTLLASKLAYPDIGEKIDDRKIRKGEFPKNLRGKYSLEAFGYRLGILKGTYCKQENCWDKWSRDMQTYCSQDVMVTKALYNVLKSKNISPQVLELETGFNHIISLQEQRGVKFNKEKAINLASQLKEKQLKLEEELVRMFPPKIVKETFIPKVNNKTRGYVKGVPFIKTKVIPFKPSSRQMITERLIQKYNWKPIEFTDPSVIFPNGQPKINDEILKELPYEEAPKLAEYFLLTKLIGYIAEGENAWLKCEKQGVIYGSVDTIGAVTRRCTHFSPNLAQTPNAEAPYGKECRELFEAREGFKLIGCDAKALELRCLAHYMNDKHYTDEILNGDIHTKNQLAAGLPTRNNAKTFIYGFLYGAGDEKIGSITGKGAEEGRKIRKKFLKNVPSLHRLITAVKQTIKTRGYLYSIDKGILKIREQYKGLNTLLQSAGAIAMKKALCILFDDCIQRGWIEDSFYLKPNQKVYFVLNVHDEYQAEVRPEIVEEYKELAVKAIQRAGESLGFKCPLDGDVKEGMNWYETH
ncbi:MAG: DNA polymerase [Candidatus Gastranaerophilales bacterium]|nr:DNA polymerase [Candidatus Gastranaerophilales bacterium]